ncbi:MAG: zinc ABC transporter substrate-binding protein [Bacillota bacterium]|nr:zinc ABC transporter substrate-binding protein [Bacillota bacterium]
MKKTILFLCLLLLLASCSGGGQAKQNTENQAQGETAKASTEANNDEKQTEATEKKRVYASFFPVYDLTKRIVGEKMDVQMIMDVDSEPHSFELKINDMAKLADADLIIYNGAGMELFIDDLKQVIADERNQDADAFFLDLSQGLTLLKADESEDLSSINPHTWLSVKNAMIQLDTVYQKVSSMDPENDAYYKENLERALQEFGALEQKMQEELGKLTNREKYFVTSHAAFNYLAYDYGLKQVAATGISPDLEPSAKELKDIADFVRSHGIKTIFFEGKATPKVAETLAKETGVKTATLYTMEHLSDEEAKMGYLKLMEHNLNELVKSFHE